MKNTEISPEPIAVQPDESTAIALRRLAKQLGRTEGQLAEAIIRYFVGSLPANIAFDANSAAQFVEEYFGNLAELRRRVEATCVQVQATTVLVRAAIATKSGKSTDSD